MAAVREILPLTSIRGLASVWVAADHVQSVWFLDCEAGLASALAMGSTAVDIFFVLSGFILAQVYGAMGLQQTPVFWLRRICRVYPLHLAVMGAIAVLVLSAAALHRSANPHDWAAFGVVTLLLQSFLLNETPWNPPSWSVGVELLCYAVFPLTLWLIRHVSVLVLAFIVCVMALAEIMGASQVRRHHRRHRCSAAGAGRLPFWSRTGFVAAMRTDADRARYRAGGICLHPTGDMGGESGCCAAGSRSRNFGSGVGTGARGARAMLGAACLARAGVFLDLHAALTATGRARSCAVAFRWPLVHAGDIHRHPFSAQRGDVSVHRAAGTARSRLDHSESSGSATEGSGGWLLTTLLR